MHSHGETKKERLLCWDFPHAEFHINVHIKISVSIAVIHIFIVTADWTLKINRVSVYLQPHFDPSVLCTVMVVALTLC